MKVLLINPAFTRYGGLKGHGGSMPPLNLCYLAAYSRAKYPEVEFKILDSEVNGLSHKETLDEVNNYVPDLIGITTNTAVFDSVIELTKILKDALPLVPIVLGGSHVSALPKQSLAESNADFIILREGEVTLSELICHIKNKEKDFRKINGLYFKNLSGHACNTLPRVFMENIDILPFPARDLLQNSLYRPPPTKCASLGPTTIITSSRGCPHNCGFCAANTVWTRKIRYRTAESIINEIKECITQYNIYNFNFTDEFFTADKKRVLEICFAIQKNKLQIKWICMARAQHLDEETLIAMKNAGCYEISFGIESGNKQILKKIDKSLNLTEAIKIIRIVQKVGIKTHASYILGYLDETIDTVRDTINFAKKLNTNFAAFFIASPLPGTRFYAEAMEKKYIPSDAKWINYSPLSNTNSVLNMPNLSSSIIRKWHRKAIRTYYFRFRYILQSLLSIRHWNDITNLFSGVKLLFNIKN